MQTLSFRQLFLSLLTLFGALFVASALFAWTGPTATAPGGNVAAPINVGTTDQVKDAGISVNALATFGSQYIQDKLGINKTNPVVALQVVGTVIVGNGGEVCQAVTEGGIRYNSSSKVIEYCDGTSWTALGTGSQVQVSTYDTSGTYTWTKPAAGTLAQVQCWGAGGGGGNGYTANFSGGHYNYAGGGGGGGGGYVTKQFLLSELTSSVAVTVGSGGGSTISGDSSSFGSYLNAYGGEGGHTNINGNAVGGSGGSGTGGQYETGASGGAGSWTEGAGSGGGASCAAAGGGGGGSAGSLWPTSAGQSGGTSGCGGNGGAGSNPTGVGIAGTAPGGGGGGASGSGNSGGAGAAGKCVVTVS